MIYVNKSQSVSIQGRNYLESWLKSNYDDKYTYEEYIEKIKSENKNKLGKIIWDLMPSKQMLREFLLREQGFICCYCGQRLLNNEKSPIEHLEPKSLKFWNEDEGKHDYVNVHLTYDYDNLLASCPGSARRIIHIVKENTETLEEIANLYGVSINRVVELYIDDHNFEIVRKEYDLEKIKEGDRILIIEPLNSKQQHCDTKKGADIIKITPLQENCEKRFIYEYSDINCFIKEAGEEDEEVFNTIKTLNLNGNPYLNRNRKEVLNKVLILRKKIIEKDTSLLPKIIQYYTKSNKAFAPNNEIQFVDDYKQNLVFIYLAALKGKIKRIA
jgi:uncharacterized protein (TIGR02646 family)